MFSLLSGLSFQLAVGSLSFSEQRLALDGRIIWAEARDCDGDGRSDLIVTFRRGFDLNTKRYIAWYFQTSDGRFPDRPSLERPVPSDVSFAQLVDLDNNGKTSLLLVSGNGVAVYRVTDQQHLPAEPESLFKGETVTPFAEPEDLPQWNFARVWHRGHPLEFALWQVGALQFYERKGATFVPAESIQIRPATYVNSRQSSVFAGQYSNRNMSISFGQVFPELTVGDYDGDGQPDLFAIDEDHLRVYLGHGGRFSEHADVELEFAVRSGGEKEDHSAHVSGQVIDLDGDGRSDYINNKVSGGLSSMHAETHVHLNHGGFKKVPDQVIKRNGFSALVSLIDFNGDGRPDLIEPFAEVGLFTLARAMVSKKIAVDWLFSTNHDGLFDLEHTQKLTVVLGLDFSGSGMFRGPFPHFDVDYDGDGLPDFVSSSDGSELSFHLGKKDGYFSPEPALVMKTDASPYTAPFADKKSGKVNLLTYFKDTLNKEGKLVILWNQ